MCPEKVDIGTIAKQIRENGRYSFSNLNGTEDIITVQGHGMPMWHYKIGQNEIIAPKKQQSGLYEKHGFHKSELQNALMSETHETRAAKAYEVAKPPAKERMQKAPVEKFDVKLARLLEDNYSKERIIKGDFLIKDVYDMLHGDLYEKYHKMSRKEFKSHLLIISKHYGKEIK